MTAGVSRTAKEILAAAVPRRESGLAMSAFLQISDHCNHACLHCYQVHGQRGELTTQEIFTLLDDLARSGVLFVTLSGGEVTLRPDFLEIVAHARSRRFAITIFTNGYLVDDALATRLGEEAILDAHVSVYSHRAEVHDSVTQVPGSWARTMAGIRALRRHGIAVVMKLPLMPENADSYADFIALAQSMECYYQIDPTINVREDGHRATLALRAADEAVSRFAADPIVGFLRGVKPPPQRLDSKTCAACDIAFVSPDGTIRPCPTLPFSLGNVRDTDLAVAYRDSDAARFVRELTWKDLPSCSVCELKDYCARCHANALLEDGDIFGPSRASCRWARARYRQITGTDAEANEPAAGPYGIAPEGSLYAKDWDRGARQMPAGLKSALVVGKERSTEGRRVHLRVVPGGA